MQILRSFSIIAAVILIIASSNISFKSGHNDVSARINGEAPFLDNVFLSIDDQSIFSSSLLQAINAQEQEEKIDQEENGKDSDAVMDKEEEQQDEEGGDSEKESSIEQEQDGSEVQQKQDEIKVDCARGEHFDSELNSCIPDEEKVCDDDRDNDNDGRVDSEDSDCLHDNNEQEQQNNGNEQENKEKLPAIEEQQSLDNKEGNNGKENPVSIVEQQNNNNDTSSDNYETEDRAQNSTQNLTDSNSTETTTTTTTTITNNNASVNESHDANVSAVVEDSFTLKCHPAGAEMLPGEQGSITCTIENTIPKPIEVILGCSGLEGTGIECSINGERSTGTTVIKEMSDTNFSVLLVSRSSPPVPAGSYPFTISAEECIDSDLC